MKKRKELIKEDTAGDVFHKCTCITDTEEPDFKKGYTYEYTVDDEFHKIYKKGKYVLGLNPTIVFQKYFKKI